MEWIEMGFIVLAAFIAARYLMGVIIHMILRNEMKEIRRDLMQKDADIRKLERMID